MLEQYIRAGRLVSGTSKHDHISPVLACLQWLSICFCTKFKVLMLTFRILNDLATCMSASLSEKPVPPIPPNLWCYRWRSWGRPRNQRLGSGHSHRWPPRCGTFSHRGVTDPFPPQFENKCLLRCSAASPLVNLVSFNYWHPITVLFWWLSLFGYHLLYQLLFIYSKYRICFLLFDVLIDF